MQQPCATEITALASAVDELDYYELLSLSQDAPAHDIRSAYHAASRRFHPDAHRQQGAELRAATATISKRVCEAYAVLRDPRRRGVYDDFLKEGGDSRLALGEIQEHATRRERALKHGATPQGQQFFGRALADMKREDWASATHNLRTALAFEPDNPNFREKFEDAEARLSAGEGR